MKLPTIITADDRKRFTEQARKRMEAWLDTPEGEAAMEWHRLREYDRGACIYDIDDDD